MTADQKITKCTEILSIIVAALWVGPTNDADKVSDKGGDPALEENIIVQQDILSADRCIVFLNNSWK